MWGCLCRSSNSFDQAFLVGIRKCSLRIVVTDLYFLRDYQNWITYWGSSWSHPVLSCGKQQKGIHFWEGKLTVGSPSCLNSSVSCLDIFHCVQKFKVLGINKSLSSNPEVQSFKGETQDLAHNFHEHTCSPLSEVTHIHSKHHFGGLEGWRVVKQSSMLVKIGWGAATVHQI